MAPTFIHSRNAYVTYLSSTGATIDFSAGCTEAHLNRKAEAADTTHFGSAIDRAFINGLSDSDFATSGMFASTYAKSLFGLLGQNTNTGAAGHQTQMVFAPQGNTAGNRKYTFYAVLKQIEIAAPFDDKVTMNTQWQVEGAVTPGTI